MALDINTFYWITGIATTAVLGWFFTYYYSRKDRRPLLEVRVSPKENYFQKRITVHNRNDTVYRYKIRVGKKYLKWQSDIVSSGNKTVATLGPDNGSGIILDDVNDQLADQDIIIECLDWHPWPWSKVVFQRRFKDV